MPGFDPSSFPGTQIHESAYIDLPCEIGAGTRIWHFSHVMQGARIGENCKLGQNVVISPGAVLGRNVKLQNNVSVYTGVVLEDDVFCGPSMVFTNIAHPRSEIPRRDQYVETRVERGATLGANSTVVCGVHIGRYALVAAGAVVTHDVPAYALMMGVPARRAGWVCRCGETLGQPSSEGGRTCGACGNEYAERRFGPSGSPTARIELVPLKEIA
jgi:UDP-2-acetamido-3-amino-2,3-dideoxy-glucuronate N-acetyltransferase